MLIIIQPQVYILNIIMEILLLQNPVYTTGKVYQGLQMKLNIT